MVEKRAHLTLVQALRDDAQGADTGATEGSRREFVDYVFEKYRSPLLRYLTTLLSNAADAEDILQETYIRISGSGTLDCLEVRARSYLYMIATNLVRDRVRHEKVRVRAERLALEDLQALRENPRPDQTLQWNESLNLVKRCLEELKPRCRRVFLLSLVENLSYREIAEVLGVSTKTVERDMQMAMQFCQARLKDW